MKQYGHLWERMMSFENLLRAAHAAARGKRLKAGIARLFFNLEPELLRLYEELVAHAYRPGPYRTFTIYEGKKRAPQHHGPLGIPGSDGLPESQGMLCLDGSRAMFWRWALR